MLLRREDPVQSLRQIFPSASDNALSAAALFLASDSRPVQDADPESPPAKSGGRAISFSIFLVAVLLFVAFSAPLALTTIHLNRGAGTSELANMLRADLRVVFRCPHKASEVSRFITRATDFAMTPYEAASEVCERGAYDRSPQVSDTQELFTQAWTGEVERRSFDLINEMRGKNGRRPLVHDDSLGLAARRHSQFMGGSGLFQHSLDGHGENILKMHVGYTTHTRNGSPARRAPIGTPADIAEEAAEAWMDSPIHRKNILRQPYRWTGLGVTVVDAPDGDGHLILFTQRFASSQPQGAAALRADDAHRASN